MDNNLLQDKLNKIKLIVSDVDGVLTDGKIYLASHPDSDVADEIKAFSARDGFRSDIFLRAGYHLVWFTGRQSSAVTRRAQELGADLIFKKDVGANLYTFLADTYHVVPEQVLYIGDDWNDLYLMSLAGVSVSPANGTAENKKSATIITSTSGGEGVLSEVIEVVMRSQGKWDEYATPYSQKFVF